MEPKDEPLWDSESALREERKNDLVLKVGDVIQRWMPKRVEGGMRYQWFDGEVLAVAASPCEGEGAPAWVALIQWGVDDKVTDWKALPSHEWEHSSLLIRRKPLVRARKKKRDPEKNRRLVLSLDEVLGEIVDMSGAGHPHDIIDRDTASIRPDFDENGRVNGVVVEWRGYPTDADDYGK